MSFSSKISKWQKTHGRNALPWQKNRDPYRVWLSEIMLQQTTVSAVIPYYTRFLKRFPDISSLARARLDSVLKLWSGLGYYSRARNLHASASKIQKAFGGVFPKDFEKICELPGIGVSTAGAIAVFSFGQFRPILDGNVKRVFARFFGVSGFPGDPKIQKTLWDKAQTVLAKTDIRAYTQGLMDLGATICTRTKPGCPNCPVKYGCFARKKGLTAVLPFPKPKKALPKKGAIYPLVVLKQNVFLLKRPAKGIWGGLWCLPEFFETKQAGAFLKKYFGIGLKTALYLDPLNHTFTHFKLGLQPILVPTAENNKRIQAFPEMFQWVPLKKVLTFGLPKPIRTILENFIRTPPPARSFDEQPV